MKTKEFERVLHEWGNKNNISITVSESNRSLESSVSIVGFDRKTNEQVLNIVVMGKNASINVLKKYLQESILKAGLTHLTKCYIDVNKIKKKQK